MPRHSTDLRIGGSRNHSTRFWAIQPPAACKNYSRFIAALGSDHLRLAVKSPGEPHPYRYSGLRRVSRVLLRHPQHRRGGPASRGRGNAGPVPEHRRPGRFRVQDAAAPDRRGRAGAARRPQRLRSVGRHSRRRAKRWRAEYTAHGWPISAGSRLHHRGHVGRDRARADARWSTRTAKCWCRCRPIRSTRR